MIIKKIVDKASESQIDLLCRLGFDFDCYGDYEKITVQEASAEIDKLIREKGLKFYGGMSNNE